MHPRFTLPVIVALLLCACTLTFQPYRPTGDKGERVGPCAPYYEQPFDPMPEVPHFSKRERENDSLFKRKLAGYTKSLQTYIEQEHLKQNHAYLVYAKECHLL